MWTRRRALRTLAAVGACAALRPSPARAQPRAILTRPIPSTGELLPVVGLGTWITFNVGDDPVARDACANVMRNFVEAGGRMIDSSPMYGSSQDVIGYGLRKAALGGRIFSADKVWISSGAQGREQIERSRRKWQVGRFDLVQVHNLLNWQEHLPTLFAMKAAGQVRYVGITTSEGRRHRDIEQLMRNHAIDFVQVTYNPRGSRGRGADPAARPRSRHRGDRESAVPRRRAGSRARATTAAPVGRGHRLHELGAVGVEVHRLAPCRHVCDPGHDQRCPRPGEHECGVRSPARRGVAPAHDRGGGAGLMSEWWTYRLTSFLLFSPRTYYRLLELYNLAIWPAQIVGVAIGLAIVALLVAKRGGRDRIIAGLLAACWLWVAWAFQYQRYAQINWVAPWFAAAFALEALLLVVVGVLAGRIVLRARTRRQIRDRNRGCRNRSLRISAAGAARRTRVDDRRDLRRRGRPDGDRDCRGAGAGPRAHPMAAAGRSAALVRDRGGDAVGDGGAGSRCRRRACACSAMAGDTRKA